MIQIYQNDENSILLVRLLQKSASGQNLRKLVFSKSINDGIKKSELTLKEISGNLVFQLESFYTDNKAKHQNIRLDDEEKLLALVAEYGQINLLTTAGDCELKRSKAGNSTLIGGAKLEKALFSDNDKADKFAKIEIGKNNKQKNYILKGDEPFLKLLEVSDKNGRVYDKRQAKFRQINRFLELIRDVEQYLPSDNVLRICDLCCGKSYLSFAVYHYFSVIRKRKVKMTGVDLKSDVIDYCSSIAKKLGFDGLEFLHGDVKLYDTDDKVNMVISLHACDTATDMVIGKAIAWNADVILSTPCCHHDLNRKINNENIEFITSHSMLRQKLCDAATDALRLKLMEANGYDVCALELIDPEETPKNIMLRGIKRHNFDTNGEKAKDLMEQYKRACRFLTGLDSLEY